MDRDETNIKIFQSKNNVHINLDSNWGVDTSECILAVYIAISTPKLSSTTSKALQDHQTFKHNVLDFKVPNKVVV